MKKHHAQHFIALSQLCNLTQTSLAQAETRCFLQQDLIRFAYGESGRDDNALARQLQQDKALQQRYDTVLSQLQVCWQPAAAAAAGNEQSERITDTFVIRLKQARQQNQTYVMLSLLQPLAQDGTVPVVHLQTTPPQRLLFSAFSEGKAQILLDNSDPRLALVLSAPLSLVC